MCSVVILRRPGHDWPLLLGANRDEMVGRPWRPPGRHWPDRPDLVAGLDETAGGSWLGLNDHGVVAAVLNRVGTLGPAEGKRSRGELVLESLDHADAAEAAEALSHLNPQAYRPFNLLLADNRDAYVLIHRGDRLALDRVPEGLSMLTAHDLNDTAHSARQRFYQPLFAAAAVPDPDAGDWRGWETLLASRIWDGEEAGPRGAMCVVTPVGFETVCSSLLALPSAARAGRAGGALPVFRFAPGRPDRTAFAGVDLG
ncbi:NRDE family protein [Oleisolibacter albus]|uniref:NRDE family protein n=1 Tax=Oleisolibacter albus TaxID=2171757 RepID=UPI000DF1B476|nr:NRDE family protein [Oleisolibacter albus]